MKNILVPTDLTECTTNTLRYAINVANRSNSNLIFFHASKNLEINIQEYALQIIKDAYEFLKLDYNPSQVEIIIEDSSFSNDLVIKRLFNSDINLLIMGASVDNLRVTFFGSYISGLINEVNCPVLSIPQGFIGLEIRKIGFATTLYDLSYRIKDIIPLAELFLAEIEAFYVYPVFPALVDLEKFDKELALQLLKNENSYKKFDLQFIKTDSDNDTVTGINTYIEIYKPDMLAMYHEHRSTLERILDSGATSKLVKISSVPMMTLNEKTSGKLK